jgi:S1-C subfamily serine protease
VTWFLSLPPGRDGEVDTMSEQQPNDQDPREPQEPTGPTAPQPPASWAAPDERTAPVPADGQYPPVEPGQPLSAPIGVPPAPVDATRQLPPAVDPYLVGPPAPAGPPTSGPSGYVQDPYGTGQQVPYLQGGQVPTQPPSSVAVDPRRRRVRRPALIGIAAGVLAAAMLAGGVTGYAIADHSQAARTTVTVQDPDGDGAASGTIPGGSGQRGGVAPGNGFGDSGSGSSGSSSTQSSATAATAEQQVGVVTIVSKLGYQNGESAGTGMVLTSGGIVLTNNHVIDGATSIEVTVESTGKTYTATVLGTDATNDVAVLQLQGASGLSTVKLDTSGTVTAGDTVTAVGNAEGTGNLVAATGDVTATDQTMTASESGSSSETLSGLIEFSAAVVSGDSGGPVLDAQGEVVGITTAASSGSADTVAYAIDINHALTIAKQIEAGKASDTVVIGYPAFLGVQVADSSALGGQSSLAGPGGIDQGSTSTIAGAAIADVIADTPAAGIGLAAGDTITAVDGTTISTATQLSTALAKYAPGDSVTITWVSGTTGATQSATVTLIQGPAA